MSRNWNEYNLNPFMRIGWRASLYPRSNAGKAFSCFGGFERELRMFIGGMWRYVRPPHAYDMLPHLYIHPYVCVCMMCL